MNRRSKDGKNSWCKECTRKYCKEYRNKHPEANREYRKEYYKQNREKVRECAKEHYIRNRDNILRYTKNYRAKRKLEILQKISGLEKPICSNCGCDDLRFLEVNHINGGGRLEDKKFKNLLYNRIINGKRKVDDLNVLCKMCNSLHYLQIKYSNVPAKIIWFGKLF